MPEANITLGMDLGPALAKLDQLPAAVKNTAEKANAALKLNADPFADIFSDANRRNIDDTSDSIEKHGKETNKLSQFISTQRKEQKEQNFLFRESRGLILLTSMAFLSMSQTGGEVSESQRKINSSLMTSIGVFQAADFAIAGLGLASGGTATAIAGLLAVGSGLISFFKESGEAAKKAAEEGIKNYEERIKNLSVVSSQELLKKTMEEKAKLEAIVKAGTETTSFGMGEYNTTGGQVITKRKDMTPQKEAEYVNAVARLKEMSDNKEIELLEKINEGFGQQYQHLTGINKLEAELNQLRMTANATGKQSDIDAVVKKEKEIAEIRKSSDEKAKERIDAYEKRREEIDQQTAAVYEFEEAQNKKAIEDAKKLAEEKKKESTERIQLINLEYALGNITAENAIRQLRVEQLLTDNALERLRIQRLIDEIKNDELEVTQKIIDVGQETLSAAKGAVDNLVNVKEQSVRKDLNNEKKLRGAALDKEQDEKLSHARTQKAKDKINEEYALKKAALDEEMNRKYNSTMESAWNTQKAFAVAQATVSTYDAANKAYAALAGIPVIGPTLAAIAAGIITVAGLANVKAILSTEPVGLAKGTKVTKPTLAMIGEGDDDEYVAPEQDFLTVARTDLIPKVLELVTRDGINVNGYRAMQESQLQSSLKISMRGVERRLMILNDNLSKLELTAEIDDRKLNYIVKKRDKKNKRITI